MRVAAWSVIVLEALPTGERRFLVSVGSCAITCVAQRSKSWAALARSARAATSLTRNHPSLGLLVGEARQSAQVTAAGTGQVAAVDMSQVFSDRRGHGRLQWCGADPNPSLEMARAGPEQDTRLMAIGSHARQNIRRRVIQIEENIAGVAILSEREKVDVKALKVACAQEAQYRSPQQLTNIPHSLAWTRPSCE